MFAVVDIETTGGSPKTEKITEIAIYIHDGLTVVDEFVTLVNPEVTIPYFITGLTGITNEMVADAPKFFEVARKVVEMTENRIFVAHNVNFDYSFIRNEYKSLGFEYNRKTLDTIKLARQVIPGLPSYSLGKLCKQLAIPLTNRHRAGGDALATVRLLEELLARDKKGVASKILKPGNPQGLNEHLTQKVINKLPEATGVYYFWDRSGELIYVGKSKNIRSRVLQHLYNQSTRRAMEMKDRLADITWELTGNELIALLLESEEIKKLKPIYNRAQRRSTFSYGLYLTENRNGYQELHIESTNQDDCPLTTFSSKTEGKELMHRWVEEYHLCQKLCGLYESGGACFHHSIHECSGACIGVEPSESYNQRVGKLLEKFEYEFSDFLILGEGRMKGEIGLVCIEKGRYMGYGYISDDHTSNVEVLRDSIKGYPNNRDVHVLIKQYLRKYTPRLIPLRGELGNN